MPVASRRTRCPAAILGQLYRPTARELWLSSPFFNQYVSPPQVHLVLVFCHHCSPQLLFSRAEYFLRAVFKPRWEIRQSFLLDAFNKHSLVSSRCVYNGPDPK
ncbi:hypothetical protein DPMN_093547 [Dreissena polymorpha]|uniref:Uncharacterized protein n=1 Tax=Dreissena polymorpha TaxID=45954 RepID=A0A9D4R137_DREPO|nr:hypothetical protein DPMN_093547 [Dreissena polymorpha]